MKAFANETYTPSDQKDKDEPTTFEIKALTSLELTEVLADGSNDLKMNKGMKFDDVKRILRLGLVDNTQIDTMLSIHHAEVANAIYTKALVAENERKNS